MQMSIVSYIRPIPVPAPSAPVLAPSAPALESSAPVLASIEGSAFRPFNSRLPPLGGRTQRV